MSTVGEGYSGLARSLLEKFGVTTGQTVRVQMVDGFESEGLLIPRYEHADNNHIVLKLKSGYNIGIGVQSVRSISVVNRQTISPKDSSSSSSFEEFPQRSAGTSKPLVFLLSTGGTIASRIDYRTGAVHPALSAHDLRAIVPELDEIAVVKPEVVFSTSSENFDPALWHGLSDKIVEHANEDAAAGITVMMGTDTLAYTSAALSFSLLGIGKPVVCVGAQRSSDRPSADSAINLKAAVSVAANFHRPGVYVAMHANENDDEVAIHRGTRVRKNHTSRRDAFKSIDIDCVALLRDGEIISESQDFEAVEQTLQDRVSNKTNFESSVSLLKFYPGFDPEILTFLSNGRKMKGIIIEATGLGHVSAKMIPRIAALTGDGIFVGITSQCIWGRVDLNVYDLGMDLLRANAVPLGNMLGETAFAKLAWVAGNFPRDSWSEIMLANLAGEHTSRTVL